MNTLNVNETPAHEGGNSSNQPAPTSPPPARHARDGGCCACCGDYRNAVIIMDVFIMVMNLVLLILAALDEDFWSDNGFIPAGGQEYGPDEEEFYGLVRPCMILSIVSLVLAAVSVLGAVIFNRYLVLVNALWLPIGYITGIALVASYCGGRCYWTDTYGIVLNKVLFGIAMIFFLWPHVGFVAKANVRNNGSRANRGALANDAYAEEEYRCCFARARNINARVHEDEGAADPGTEGVRSEIDVETPQPLSDQNKTSVAWGKKHALKVVVVVAVIFLIIGLSVGLTQNSSKEVSLRGSTCAGRKWHYSTDIAGCTNAEHRGPGRRRFDSLRECCLYHFGMAICRSLNICTGVSGDHGPGRPDYDWTDYGSSEDGSEDNDGMCRGTSGHGGCITVRLPDPDECEQLACGVPKYEQGHMTTCGALMSRDEQTNSYWQNDNFLCRTNERPCLATSSELVMEFPNGMRIYFDTDSELRDFGPAEVWHFRTDRFGNMIMEPWSSPYQFFADGRWFYDHEEFAKGHDFSNYRFPSLQCHSREPDPNNLAFIVIDGVLVDSCPKSVAEKCRACEGPRPTGCPKPPEYGSRDHSPTIECEQEACDVQPYEPHPLTTCEALMSHESTNSYWSNANFLCRTNERPCEATSSVLDLNLEDGLTNYGLKYTGMTDGSQDFPVIPLPTDLDLRDGMSITFDEDEERNEMFHAQFGSQVWHIRTNQEGDLRSGWTSPYRFYAEGRWFNVNDSQRDAPILGAFDSYLFGSLECLGPQADDEFVFIVIDGVLVDSCPKSVAEKCRACNSRDC